MAGQTAALPPGACAFGVSDRVLAYGDRVGDRLLGARVADLEMTMAQVNDHGGPAFPVPDLSKTQCHGMSLRDYFAGQALNAWVSTFNSGRPSAESSATLAYELADAMLAARSQPSGGQP